MWRLFSQHYLALCFFWLIASFMIATSPQGRSMRWELGRARGGSRKKEIGRARQRGFFVERENGPAAPSQGQYGGHRGRTGTNHPRRPKQTKYLLSSTYPPAPPRPSTGPSRWTMDPREEVEDHQQFMTDFGPPGSRVPGEYVETDQGLSTGRARFVRYDGEGGAEPTVTDGHLRGDQRTDRRPGW